MFTEGMNTYFIVGHVHGLSEHLIAIAIVGHVHGLSEHLIAIVGHVHGLSEQSERFKSV